jgi:hypothetical protein
MLLGTMLAFASVVAAEPSAAEIRQLKAKLMVETKLIAVAELDVPSHEYESDGDPDTLEIVFLTKKTDGPSRVTSDGEVIFLYEASDEEQEALINEAFDIRVRNKLRGT